MRPGEQGEKRMVEGRGGRRVSAASLNSRLDMNSREVAKEHARAGMPGRQITLKPILEPQ